MEIPIRDVSFNQVLEDTSLIFLQLEAKNPTETFLPQSIKNHYLRTLNQILFFSAKENDFSVESFLQFSLFLSCIIKSTLYFHYCFDHSIKEPDTKLALMFGDLYLVKGGEQLVKIKNFLRLHPSFRELLYSISMSQRFQGDSKEMKQHDFEKIVKMSYGYIFRFALLAPYIWKKNPLPDKRKLTFLARDMSLFLAWQVEPFLHAKEKNPDLIKKLHQQIVENLGEENYVQYHFDGWKEYIQKNT